MGIVDIKSTILQLGLTLIFNTMILLRATQNTIKKYIKNNERKISENKQKQEVSQRIKSNSIDTLEADLKYSVQKMSDFFHSISCVTCLFYKTQYK